MEIRYATNKDIPQLAGLFANAVEFHQNQAGYYELLPNFDWAAYAEDKITNLSGRVLVAEDNKKLSGFIYVRVIEYSQRNPTGSFLQRLLGQSQSNSLWPVKSLRWGVIEECYVAPLLRRNGIGRRLVEGAVNWFRLEKIDRIELSMIARNKQADAFWRTLGFETFRVLLSKNI